MCQPPIIPPALKEGDAIAIVATARFVSAEEVEPAARMFRQWGMKVKIYEGLFEKDGQMAGSDEHRARMLQNAIDDEEVRAIVVARGGYGTVRMVDRVDFSPLEKSPKWVVGYSDVTVLHSHIHRHCAVATLHGTMPIDIKAEEDFFKPAAQTMKELLMGGECKYVFGSNEMNREGESEGIVVGGNLSILYSLLGSASAMDTKDKILLIEDLDEYLYHIDRMMMALKRSGMLAQLKGLIVGGMSDMHDNKVPFGKSAYEIVKAAVEEYDYPVVMGVPMGHIGTENRAIVLGSKVGIKARSNGESSIFTIKKE